MTEKEFSELIASLYTGTSIDTPTGTFFEVVSYLEGYGKGMAVVETSHSVFTPFLRWFSNKLGQKQLEMPITWIQFRELYSSDEEALKNLSTLYKEYVESSTPQD